MFSNKIYNYATGFFLLGENSFFIHFYFFKENTENMILVFSKITHFHFHFLENVFCFLHPNTFSYTFSFSMKNEKRKQWKFSRTKRGLSVLFGSAKWKRKNIDFCCIRFTNFQDPTSTHQNNNQVWFYTPQLDPERERERLE